MKILYIGVYRDGTGWGQAAIDNILALDAAGADVVPRALKLNNRDYKPPERVVELESKSSRGCDVVIQHILPIHMDYNGLLRNIGLFHSETSDFKSSGWTSRLNTMDSLILCNHQQVGAAISSGVTKPISVVPLPTDIKRFQQNYPMLDEIKRFKDNGDFIFYFIGELVRRKNLPALLKAFHLEFDPREPVQLVIKADWPGRTADDAYAHVNNACHEMKRGLKLYRREDYYKKEIVLTDRLTEHGIMKLHSSCDCFVMPSYGEGWSIPAFDAMAMGKTPIVSECTAFPNYISNKEGWLVDGRREPVFGEMDTFEDLFVGTETWFSVDINHLRKCMREAYEKESIRMDKAINGISKAYEFSYNNIGPRLIKAIENDQKPQRQQHRELDGTS